MISTFTHKIKNPTTTFWILIGWSVFGFFTNLDYTDQWGCSIVDESIFSELNIFYSGLSLLLLLVGFLIPFRQIRYLILIGELIFWIYKLMIIKGGYSVGFGGVPSLSVLIFDIVALTLRLLLIKQIFALKFNSLYLLIPTFIIISVKINFFQTQQKIVDEFEDYPKEIERMKNQLIGTWTGISRSEITIVDTVKYQSLFNYKEDKKVEQFDTITISIDSNILQIEGIEKFNNESYLIQFMTISDLNLWNVLPDSLDGDLDLMEGLGTDLKVNAGIQNAGLQIYKLTEDTMICSLDYKYEITLLRKN